MEKRVIYKLCSHDDERRTQVDLVGLWHSSMRQCLMYRLYWSISILYLRHCCGAMRQFILHCLKIKGCELCLRIATHWPQCSHIRIKTPVYGFNFSKLPRCSALPYKDKNLPCMDLTWETPTVAHSSLTMNLLESCHPPFQSGFSWIW